MRTLTIVLFGIVALLGTTQMSGAQSAYSYPWCSLGGPKNSNALSCYYTSWEQCRTTQFGIGGMCVQSPYYHAQSIQSPRRSSLKTRQRPPA